MTKAVSAQQSTAATHAAPPATRILEFYAQPAGNTIAGQYASLIAELPTDPVALVRAVPGLIVHEYLAGSYGLTVPNERRAEAHIRPVERMLERIVALDPSPLSTPRPPEKRLVGVCRHFEVLLTGMLRAKGIPARVRRGFGTYFDPRMSVDHEITELWSSSEARWIRIDAQLDDVQRHVLHIDFDPLDVPADKFLIPAVAWQESRAGKADPNTFGILEMRGLWFIASNLIRDVAWLTKHEMLPWDVWGGMPEPDHELTDDDFTFFDRLAEITIDPDASFDDLLAIYADDRIRVPNRVFNANLNREETV